MGRRHEAEPLNKSADNEEHVNVWTCPRGSRGASRQLGWLDLFSFFFIIFLFSRAAGPAQHGHGSRFPINALTENTSAL